MKGAQSLARPTSASQPWATPRLKVLTVEFSLTTGIALESPVQTYTHALPSVIN